MGITLGTNIPSLSAQRKLSETTSALSRSFERLSSGQRINKASDDAAGLSISESLDVHARVFSQGIRNLNDGLSALHIADAAISQLSNIVIRQEELASQAANGTYGAAQRAAINTEAQALSAEYLRITQSTEFNGLRLLDGSSAGIRLQAGFGLQGGLEVGLQTGSDSIQVQVGTGAFSTAAPSYADGEKIALGDLNGDGVADLVSVGGATSLRLGNGNGTFGAKTTIFAMEAFSGDVVLGDINNDGFLDMVTAGRSAAYDGYASVRLGNGNGTFSARIQYTTETRQSNGVALGDLNGDGKLDLVTAGENDGATGWASVRLGNGNGTFAAKTSYATEATRSYEAMLRDLNRDGKLDLITAGENGATSRTTVRFGVGDGTFGAATGYTSPEGVTSDFGLGDVDGDGVDDLITAGEDNQFGYMSVRLGVGDGTFGAAVSRTDNAGSVCYSRMTTGDVNGDGMSDVITAGAEYGSYDGQIIVWLATGGGNFSQQAPYVYPGNWGDDVALADVSGDGVFDLVAGLDDFVAVRLADTTTTTQTLQAGVPQLADFSLASATGARQALDLLSGYQEQLSELRGSLGASMARIGVALNTLEVSRQNFMAAASRIRDADIAQEASMLTKQQILQQIAAATLAQANQQPAIALALLK